MKNMQYPMTGRLFQQKVTLAGFNYHLENVMVKAIDIIHPVKEFKWEVMIDGKQYGATRKGTFCMLND